METEHVTKAELRELIRSAINESFLNVGLNHEEVFELRKDLTFLREQRIMCESLRTRGIWYMGAIVLSGIVGLILIGFKGWVSGPL